MSPPVYQRHLVFYAVVQHDFMAERADELDAKAGEYISVVAQSNYEWFVAKPIGKLGRPGLIPVSFVAIHDLTTGRVMPEEEVKLLMERGDIPGVEEWKKSILEYKAASISLGVIEDDRGPVLNSPFMPPSQTTPKLEKSEKSEVPYHTQSNEKMESLASKMVPLTLPSGILLSADVVSWHFEMDEYWFRIHALFQPDDPSGSETLPPAKHLILFRVYDDFHTFQVNLLKTFPVEAGNELANDQITPKRILPYMPGHTDNVNDRVTSLRKEELDQYLSQLCALWELGAEYILRHKLIRDFFTPKAGDAEEDVEPAYRIFNERNTKQHDSSQDEIREPLEKMIIRDQVDSYSDGSNYDDEHDYGRSSNGRSTKGTNDGAAYQGNAISQARYNGYDKQGYGGAYSEGFSSYRSGASPPPQSAGPVSMERNYSAEAALSRSSSNYYQNRNDHEQTVTYTSHRRPEDDSPRSFTSNPSQPPSATSGGSGVTRNRSASNANSPPISANNPNPAFIKIKVFDSLTQDLIAIRVNPRVTHEQLMEKVRARLGSDVKQLAYRSSVYNNWKDLTDDRSLKDWLESTDKHVLYADPES